MLPKNKTMQARRQTKEGRKEETDLGVAEWRIPVLEDRERGQPEGERAMQVHAAQAQRARATSTRKRKERKRQGMKRGEGRANQRGGKDGGGGKVRGGGRKRARRAMEGKTSGRQMAIVTATQKREKEGEEGRGRREKGQHTTHHPKNWKGRVSQVMSEQEEREGVKRGATGGQDGRATSNVRERDVRTKERMKK
jgi:hypothetical protein